MALLKTKEVAKELGVSQTTILRWVKGHPSSARKDRLGHFVFGDSEIASLRRIQASIQETGRFEQENPETGSGRIIGSLNRMLPFAGSVPKPEPVKLLALPAGPDRASSTEPQLASPPASPTEPQEAAGAPAPELPAAEPALAFTLPGEDLPHLFPEPQTADLAFQSKPAASYADIDAKEAEAQAAAAAEEETDAAMLLDRIGRLEFSLARKADEVVSVQLLEHRRELEEIRLSLKQLAASVEKMKNSGKEDVFPSVSPLTPAGDPPKKRRFFRALFG